jgi:exosortase
MHPALPARPALPRWLALAFVLAPAALVAWAWWTTLGDLAVAWANSAQHSHGYLVPAFAALLLWLRRDRLRDFRPEPNNLGWPLLAAGIAMRVFGTYCYYLWFDQMALVPCLAGLVLLFGGRGAWRWAGPSVLFLAFMVPLPYTAAVALTDPLQRLATTCSTFALQTLGLPAIAEGNVILLNDVRLGVVEACSGLRMLLIFFALSTAVALVMRRPLWERAMVVASAVPIALLTNVLRITVTGVLHETVGAELANAVFHDLAGWLMMPVALAMLGLELQILKRLVVQPPAAQTVKVNIARIDVAGPRPQRRRVLPPPAAPASAAAPALESAPVEEEATNPA